MPTAPAQGWVTLHMPGLLGAHLTPSTQDQEGDCQPSSVLCKVLLHDCIGSQQSGLSPVVTRVAIPALWSRKLIWWQVTGDRHGVSPGTEASQIQTQICILHTHWAQPQPCHPPCSLQQGHHWVWLEGRRGPATLLPTRAQPLLAQHAWLVPTDSETRIRVQILC